MFSVLQIFTGPPSSKGDNTGSACEKLLLLGRGISFPDPVKASWEEVQLGQENDYLHLARHLAVCTVQPGLYNSILILR